MKTIKFPLVVKVGSAVVKIYRGKVRSKGKRYPAFTLAYYRDGKRERSVFASLDEAKKAAQEIALKIAHGRLAVAELGGADAEAYQDALELLEPTGVSLRSAVEQFVDAHRKKQESGGAKPVPEIVEEMLQAKERDGLSIRYIHSLRSHLRRFAQTFPRGIGSITSKMIEQWLAGLGLGPRSRNNLRMSVVTFFEYARRVGYLPKHERTEALDVGRAKDNGGAVGILEPKQLALLLSKANEEAALWLAIGAFSGLRTAEMLRLEWSDFNLKRHNVIVGKHKSKTATRRIVPVLPNLRDWLLPYHGRTGQLFSSHHVPDRVIAFAKQYVRWPNNALRHSYATYRLAATQDAAKVALEMGNSPTMLFTNYRELADEHDAKAWFAIAPKRSGKIVQFATPR